MGYEDIPKKLHKAINDILGKFKPPYLRARISIMQRQKDENVEKKEFNAFMQ